LGDSGADLGHWIDRIFDAHSFVFRIIDKCVIVRTQLPNSFFTLMARILTSTGLVVPWDLRRMPHEVEGSARVGLPYFLVLFSGFFILKGVCGDDW